MREDILKTVEVLRGKIRAKEEESARLKKIINDLHVEEGEPAPYPNVSPETSGSVHELRSDQFYGQPLGAAARKYLEIRKSSGLSAASLPEIYRALKAGGVEFDTQNDEYAKNGIRIALRKNPVFHRLPNGDYGLREWYGLKPEADGREVKSKTRKKRKRSAGYGAKVKDRTSDKAGGPAFVATHNNGSTSRSQRILSAMQSNKTKEWNHHELHKDLSDLTLEEIRVLLYSLAKTSKITKTGPGKFMAA